MLVMQSTNIPFQELASKIAKEFIVKGASLEDSIVDEAKKRDLKPEEVKRLVEKSNTAASILYLKNYEDKKGSFDLAKKENVLKRTHPTEAEEELTDADDVEDAIESELPETRKTASYKEPEIHTLEKQASKSEELTVHDIFAARDRLAEIKQLKFATEMKLQDILHGIIAEYQYKSAAELSKLAADASALYGSGVLAVIDTAAEYMKKPIVFSKFASDIIDDTTGPMRLLKEASVVLEMLPKMADSISKLEDALLKAC